MDQVADLEGIILSKDASKKTKVSHDERGDSWNKRSIFCNLPYFKTLLLCHNLDVMHIEKNICDSIMATIMDVKGKTKDNINSRRDLQLMKIRPGMHPARKVTSLLFHLCLSLCFHPIRFCSFGFLRTSKFQMDFVQTLAAALI